MFYRNGRVAGVRRGEHGRGACRRIHGGLEGENLHDAGFLAMKLEDERKVPGLFVDQLVKIIDVTKEVQDATESGKTADEKISNKTKKILTRCKWPVTIHKTLQLILSFSRLLAEII